MVKVVVVKVVKVVVVKVVQVVKVPAGLRAGDQTVLPVLNPGPKQTVTDRNGRFGLNSGQPSAAGPGGVCSSTYARCTPSPAG